MMEDRFKFRCRIGNQIKDVYYFYQLTENNRLYFVCTDFENHKGHFLPKNNLMQCTGLKDKNGKLIYEGDIVKRNKVGGSVLPEVEYSGIVERNFTGQYYLNAKNSKVGYNIPHGNQSEIIGNIYETPGLLEKEIKEI